MRPARRDQERRRGSQREPRGPAAEPEAPPGDVGAALEGLLARLHVATHRYVRALRADGARPEQVVLQVRAFVRDALAAEGWDGGAARALTSRIVGWSIDAYYDR
jgi:hypothetical protein